MRLLAPLVLSFALAACGGSKMLPDGSQTGRMTPQALPVVSIDGTQYRLAPGARILSANNLTVTPNQVPPDTPVRFKLDATGNVHQVWILPASK